MAEEESDVRELLELLEKLDEADDGWFGWVIGGGRFWNCCRGSMSCIEVWT